MRILQVIPRFNPILGGGVNVVYNISKELVKRGHQVTIATTKCNFDGNTRNEITRFGIEVLPFDYLFDLHLFIPSPSMDKWLQKNIRNFDIIHMHGARSYQNNLISKYAKKYNVPYVLQPHGSIQRIIDIKLLKLMYDFIYGNTILFSSSRIIALHRLEVEQIKNRGVDEDQIDIIPNGVDLLEFSNLPPGGQFKNKYKINNKKMILFLGRIHKIKGLNLLIKAFGDLINDFEDIVLVIAGPDDGFLKSVQKQVASTGLGSKIIFTGPLYGNEKLEAYVDSDVYVLPSIYETFPLTIMEACACGIPIVTTTRCGISDIVNNKVGYSTEYNKDQLRQALVEILTDHNLRETFGEEGRRLVKDQFNWAKIADKLENTYQIAINNG